MMPGAHVYVRARTCMHVQISCHHIQCRLTRLTNSSLTSFVTRRSSFIAVRWCVRQQLDSGEQQRCWLWGRKKYTTSKKKGEIYIFIFLARNLLRSTQNTQEKRERKREREKESGRCWVFNTEGISPSLYSRGRQLVAGVDTYSLQSWKRRSHVGHFFATVCELVAASLS